MALPIDCVVVVYYSASVNIASTNSQSLHPNMVPSLLIEQGQLLKNRDKRLLKRVDNILWIVTGLGQVIPTAERLLRKVIPKIVAETTTISDSLLRGAPLHVRNITQSTSISETFKKLPKRLFTETTPIADSTPIRTSIKTFAIEVIAITDTALRNVIPKIITESTAISELLAQVKARLFLKLTETVAISDSTSRFYKAVRKFIEGFTSILFSGLNTQ